MTKQLQLNIQRFASEFDRLTLDWTWEVEGFVDKNDYVHPIDTDTKVISTVFERMASPVVRSIAGSHGYVVETANQTTYPDFTITCHNTDHRIALDVKTTYESRKLRFTLGGYNSFLRNDTKNILYPYSSYDEHWILGFIYRQGARFPEYDLEHMPKRGEISCPYSHVQKFVRHKHEISGLRAGSGNTKNIGSIVLNRASDFTSQRGPFTYFADGKSASEYFWANYEQLLQQISSLEDLLNHELFQQFGPARND